MPAEKTAKAPASQHGSDDELGVRPRFTKTLRGVHIEPGDSAVFECAVQGTPAVAVSWLRNNLPLDDRLADRVEQTQNGDQFQLVLRHCRPSDAGLVTARASSSAGCSTCSAQLLVDENVPKEKLEDSHAPKFVIKMKNTELLEGTHARFMFKVVGDPTPKITFFKDGKKLKEDERMKVVMEGTHGAFELTIEGVEPGDAGKYKCVAKNVHGEAETEGDITVTNEKNLWKSLEERVLQPGEQPDFSWFKDGEEFDPGERFRVLLKDDEDSLALVFQHVKPEDAGLYTCVASTSTGKISCSAELTIQGAVHHLLREPEPPSFTLDLTDTEVSMGGSAMLDLKVTGYPKPRVTWYKDGKEVTAGGRFRFLYEDEESISLIIKNVEMGDAGKYTVVAQNDLGEVTTEGSLFVRAPPKFKKKTSDVACMTDTPLKYDVEVEGNPTPDVKWYKDGQLIFESERIKLVQESSEKFSLIIEKVTLEDSGAYSVVASNMLGQMSEFFRLTANAPPAFGKPGLQDVECAEGETLSFRVKALGNPSPKVIWMKDGKEVKEDGERITISYEQGVHTLTVHKVTRHDAGKYMCKLSNEYGAVEGSAECRVKCKPEFVQRLEDLEVQENEENVEFRCKVHSNPNASFKWYYEETEITEKTTQYKKVIEENGSTLIIKKVTEELSGKYSCEAFNALGKTKSTGVLSVLAPPKFKAGLSDKEVNEGQNIEVEVKISGVPQPTLQWTRNREDITVDKTIKLVKVDSETERIVIKNVTRTHAGEYEVVARNRLGQATSSGKITVNSKPEIGRHTLDAEAVETEETVLEIVATGIPKPSIKWYIGGLEIKESSRIRMQEDSGTYKLIITDTKREDAGTYKCVLKNKLGEASAEGKLTVRGLDELKQPKVLASLEDVTATKGEDVTMKAKIRGRPEPKVEWFHDGKKLDASETVKMETDEDHHYILRLKGVHETQAGEYSIKATNEHGSADCKAKLTVRMKPEIEGLGNAMCDYGSEVSVTAKIKANPPATVAWFKGKKRVEKSDRARWYEEDGDSFTLVISGAKEDDAGEYRCSASNDLGKTEQAFKLHVITEKPRFLKGLSEMAVATGDDAVLEVLVKGIPMPSVSWRKGDTELKESDRVKITSDGMEHRCVLKKCQESDYGKYVAVAENVAGKEESSGDLSGRMEPPTLKEKLEPSVKIREGEALALAAKVEGAPKPVVKWYKDNEEVIPDEHVVVEDLADGTQRLNIAKCTPQDAGQYKMVAVNPSGKVASDCSVHVKQVPSPAKILTPLQNATVVEGKPLELVTKVAGYPTPKVKWMRDNTPIHPSRDVTITQKPDGTLVLKVARATPEDAARYSVVASNDHGEDASEAVVEVEAPSFPPKFATAIKDVKVVEGYPAKLETQVEGHPVPVIKWMKEGHEVIPDGEHVKAFTEPDGRCVLVIEKARPEDAGTYSVVASNAEGQASIDSKLTVQGKTREGEGESPAGFLKPLPEVNVDEGKEIRLIAPVVGNPLPDVSWYKDGAPMIPSKDARVVFDGDRVGLVIPTARASDAGEYECRLKNALGEDSSKAAVGVRKLFEPPSFVQKIADLQQLQGLDAKFTARVAGVPFPDVTWTKNGAPIRFSDRIRMKQDGDVCLLFIRDCHTGDDGIYGCVARNVDGEDRCLASLSVVEKIERKERAEPPGFLKRICDCEVYDGMTAKFTACVTGHPEPEFEWFKDGTKVWPSDRITLEAEGSGLLRLLIKSVTDVDIGRYRLRIFNPHGEDACSAELILDSFDIGRVPPPSGIPLPLSDPPIISRMTDRNLTLSWRPSIPSAPRFPVTYHVEMRDLPDGEWTSFQKGIRGCACEVRNLVPFRDYQFRIRVENKYGSSDPSPHATTNRQRLVPETRHTPALPAHLPTDFDYERPAHEQMAAAPRFLSQEQEVQYGVKNHPTNVRWFVYGYPKPDVKWYLNGEHIEMGGRFSHSYTRNGCATLFINGMLDRDVGEYECVAKNEHGEARQSVRVRISEHPRFSEHLRETRGLLGKTLKLECRVEGVPFPDIKWYKDWLPLASSARIKVEELILWEAPDRCTLILTDLIQRDAGLYSCTATNLAGTASSSCTLHVDEEEGLYRYRTYQRGREVKRREKPIEDLYDLGDELGRGTQGVVYHAVERSTGKSYAAKVMKGDDWSRRHMLRELDIMNDLHHPNLIRLHDALDQKDSLTIVTELGAGGDLMHYLSTRPHITESEIAHYIRQVLWGLQHMHEQDIAHLGLTPGDILFSRPNGDDIKICDFGLAQRILGDGIAKLEFGMPEFVSPEIAKLELVNLPADMWAVGVITYLLLSGHSPFLGENDMQTLEKVKQGRFDFDREPFPKISDEAKDFITQLLAYDPSARPTVKQALRHPWLLLPDAKPRDPPVHIPSHYLRDYAHHLRDWYDNASCRTHYRRRPLAGAYTDPSRMVYPPGFRMTPPPAHGPYEPAPYSRPSDDKRSRTPIDGELPHPDSHSMYQMGPDTYLLQLRDTDFPARLRRYMNVAASRSPTFALKLRQDPWIENVAVRERRRFTDVMDEEIEDEKRQPFYNGGYSVPRRVRHEIGTATDIQKQADAYMDTKREGSVPFFREKLQLNALVEDEPAQLTCFAVGVPKPVVQWFRNDMVLQPTKRIKMETDEEGRAYLKFEPATAMDAGIYKAVARNKNGQTICRTRFLIGHKPGLVDAPDATDFSDTEVLLKWQTPYDDGNSPIVCYRVEFMHLDATDWTVAADNVDHEFYCLRELTPSTSYQFRIAARNKFGWGRAGNSSSVVTTKEPGAPKVQVSRAMRYLQEITDGGRQVEEEPVRPPLDYTIEEKPIELHLGNPADKYNLIAEIARGRFSVIVKCSTKDSDELYAAKIVESAERHRHEEAQREFTNLRSLAHERIIRMHEAYDMGSCYIIVLEKLQGVDILTYLCNKNEYTEDNVATILIQVLDGLQYLHWRGLAYLDVQPDNVVLTSVRRLEVKLVDLGSAQRVTRSGLPVSTVGHIEYMAPEVMNGEDVSEEADVWSIGVLAYVLLSGVSPFRGKNEEETKQNVSFARYRFEHLYRGITSEVTRFLMLIFKRHPQKRPSLEECMEHRWLHCTDHMLRKRERATFYTNKLRAYEEEYHREIEAEGTSSEFLMSAFGVGLDRSASVSFDEKCTF